MTDKEIQELIDKELVNNPKDKKLYDKLYHDLSQKDPNFELKSDFKLSVLDQLTLRKKQLAAERLWIIIIISIFVLVALISLAVTDAFSIFSSLSNLVWYGVIFFGLYLIFQQIEKKLFKSNPTK